MYSLVMIGILTLALAPAPPTTAAAPPASSQREQGGSVPAAPPLQPVEWGQLSAADCAFFERYAVMIRRGPDGSLWCVKVEADRLRLSQRGQGDESAVEQLGFYGEPDAPVVVNLRTAERFQSESHVLDTLRSRSREARMKALIEQTPGALITAIRIHQVLPDGLLVSFPESADGRQVFLTGFPLQRAVVDGDVLPVSMKAELVGRYQFTAVSGAVRTLEKWNVVRVFDWEALVPPDPPLRITELAPIAPEELFSLTQAGTVEEIPLWSLRRTIVQATRPGRTSRGLGRGLTGTSTSSTTQGEPAVYRWGWKVAMVHVPYFAPGDVATSPTNDVGREGPHTE